MESVLSVELNEALSTLNRVLDSLPDLGLTPADHKDATRLVKRVEQVGRKVDSVRCEVLTAIDDDLLYAPDGHFSAKVMVRHVGRLSPGEAHRRESVARALRQMSELAAAHKRGEVGTCQLQLIAKVFGNKRVRDQLVADEKRFIDIAKRLSYRSFKERVDNWVRLADEDGTADNSQANHENRDYRITQEFDLGWNVVGRCGSLEGAQYEAMLKAFVDVEFKADWAAARQEHGHDATITKDMLARTDAQRRWDAAFKMALKAAGTKGKGGKAEVVLDVVIDHSTFERELTKIFGGAKNIDPVDPWDSSFKCRTLDGRPIDTTEAVAAGFVGQVRRVVFNSAGVVTDAGRLTRFFTGNLRRAAQVAQTECGWPGCHVACTACQVDHTSAFNRQPDGSGGDGCTCTENAGMFCGSHNRLQQTGYSTYRDEHGDWHACRPDGTEIEP